MFRKNVGQSEKAQLTQKDVPKGHKQTNNQKSVSKLAKNAGLTQGESKSRVWKAPFKKSGIPEHAGVKNLAASTITQSNISYLIKQSKPLDKKGLQFIKTLDQDDKFVETLTNTLLESNLDPKSVKSIYEALPAATRNKCALQILKKSTDQLATKSAGASFFSRHLKTLFGNETNQRLESEFMNTASVFKVVAEGITKSSALKSFLLDCFDISCKANPKSGFSDMMSVLTKQYLSVYLSRAKNENKEVFQSISTVINQRHDSSPQVKQQHNVMVITILSAVGIPQVKKQPEVASDEMDKRKEEVSSKQFKSETTLNGEDQFEKDLIRFGEFLVDNEDITQRMKGCKDDVEKKKVMLSALKEKFGEEEVEGLKSVLNQNTLISLGDLLGEKYIKEGKFFMDFSQGWNCHVEDDFIYISPNQTSTLLDMDDPENPKKGLISYKRELKIPRQLLRELGPPVKKGAEPTDEQKTNLKNFIRGVEMRDTAYTMASTSEPHLGEYLLRRISDLDRMITFS